MEQVSICSGSMSYTFHLRTEVRFLSSLSHRSVPRSSAQASLRNFKSAAFSNGTFAGFWPFCESVKKFFACGGRTG